MSGGNLFKRRLGQYGALWIGTFLVVLIGALGATSFFHIDPIRCVDVLLPASFAVLGLAIVVFVVRTLMAPAGLWTKAGLLLLAVFLTLPLLWSPVLATLVCAAVTHAVIEYSNAYAQFRIIISDILYPPTAMLLRGSVVGTVWNGFEATATVVGFIASATQLWPMMLRAVVGGRGN